MFEDLLKVYPFNLAVVVFGNDKEKALSLYIPGLEEILNTFPENQKKVIEGRFKECKTLDQISREIERSRTRVSQLEQTAIKNLKKNYLKMYAVSKMDVNEQQKQIDDINNKYLLLEAKICADPSISMESKKSLLGMIVVNDLEKLYDIDIEELKLSARSINALKNKCGIYNIGELIKVTRDQLEKVRNIGTKSIDEIIEAIEKIRIYNEEKDSV